MNLVSKYEMGQRVWSIQQTRVQKADRTCGACDGAKTVELRGTKYECPECKGRGEVLVYGSGWVITNRGKIGSIRIEHEAPYHHETYGDREMLPGVPYSNVKYMLDTTGIGSGTLYEEPNLWPSREEAQAECDRRNGAQL